MNLRAALICLDCDEIFSGRPAACPRCGSKTVHRLWRWLPTLADGGTRAPSARPRPCPSGHVRVRPCEPAPPEAPK